MKIKVCGITDPAQMQQLETMGIDYGGIIFYPLSKRFIGATADRYKAAWNTSHIRKIGVFVNQSYETVLQAIKDYELYAVQLHGDETDEYCLELMDKAKVIKVFRISDQEDIDSLVSPFQEVCHYFLFDTDTDGYGGSGKQFNWKVLQDSVINKPFFLSGGIGAEDLDRLRSFQHPYLHAVDVNSRFETEPGLKDMNKVKLFKNNIQHG